MVPSSNAIDHRWGRRVAIGRAVEITTGGEDRVRGSLENASLSGAYVRTSATLRPYSRLALRAEHSQQLLQGYVVRVDAHGVGVEWLEPDAGIVPQLLAGPRLSSPPSPSQNLHHDSIAWQVLERTGAG